MKLRILSVFVVFLAGLSAPGNSLTLSRTYVTEHNMQNAQKPALPKAIMDKPIQQCGGPHQIQCSSPGMICKVRKCGVSDSGWGTCVEDRAKPCNPIYPIARGYSNTICGCDNKVYGVDCGSVDHLKSAIRIPTEVLEANPDLTSDEVCDYPKLRVEYLKWKSKYLYGPPPNDE